MTQQTALNYVTCSFGTKGSWMAGYHTGIDYRAAVGTKVFCTYRGRVIHSGTGGSYGSAYGNYVVVESIYKGVQRQHLYAHLSDAYVREGQRVRAGSLLGLSGVSGNTNGAHLHYEERVSPFNYWAHTKPVLPQWIPARKKVFSKILIAIGVKKK